MEYNIDTIEINMLRNKGLILYTRLPDYFYQSLYTFCKIYKFKCDVVRFDQDKNTSFYFEENEYIQFYNRSEINIDDFLNKGYQFVYTSTWKDKLYKKICRFYKPSIPVIIGMDNPWLGNIKQKIHAAISDFTIHRYFNFIWVPGLPQENYALKLGFKKENIIKGLYTCDTDKFIFQENFTNTKTILFVGRFVEYKNPHLLAKVFTEILKEETRYSGWKLKIVGRGPLQKDLLKFQSEYVDVRDFVKPEDLPDLFYSSTVFCLPSENEHWGVVVHEAACSGLPLILSDTVFAHTDFLVENENGFLFKSGSENELRAAIKKIMETEEEELKSMRKKSAEAGNKLTKEIWAERLFGLLMKD